jgi:hypothetical protein
LTKIATTLYLLTVKRDGPLVGEVLPRQATSKSVAVSGRSAGTADDAVDNDFGGDAAQWETAVEEWVDPSAPAESEELVAVQWAQPKFYPAVRGDQTVIVVARDVDDVQAEVQAGTVLLNSVGFDSRPEAVAWLDQQAVKPEPRAALPTLDWPNVSRRYAGAC